MKLLTLLLALAVTACAQEKPDSPKPKPVTRERPANKSFWIASAAMGASSAAPILGGNHCRDHGGPEGCTENYGAYKIWSGITVAASTFVAPAFFYGCRKEYRSRWCWAIPAIVVGGNVGWGIHEAEIRHVDLTPDSVIRRKR